MRLFKTILILGLLLPQLGLSNEKTTNTAQKEYDSWVKKLKNRYQEKFSSPTITHHIYLAKNGDEAFIDLSYKYPRFVKEDCKACQWSVKRVGEKVVSLMKNKQPQLDVTLDKEFRLPKQNRVFLSGNYYQDDNRLRVFLHDLKQKNLDKKRSRNFATYNKSVIARGKYKWLKKPETVTIQRSDGSEKEISKVGQISFKLSGKEGVLSVYNFAKNDEYKKANVSMLMYRDMSNGKYSYGAGRFLNVDFGKPLGQLKNGSDVSVDFNFSYNPPCAVSTGFHCPLPQDIVNAELGVGERYNKIY